MSQRLFILLGLILMLAACASTDEGLARVPSVEKLYSDAHYSIQAGNYMRAERQLRIILSRYPFTDYAAQAQMDMLFVYLQMEDPESLVEEAERFIRENPRHPNIDYVYYMRGMGYYQATRSLLQSLFNIDTARREVSNAEQAFTYFSQLNARFPDSVYAADAERRMIELKERIARYEIYVADYYLQQGAWVSALQRAHRVLRELQGTQAEIDALIVMDRAYTELGLDDLAENARRILAANAHRDPVIVDRDAD